MGPRPSRAHECDGLRLGLDGWNRHGDLVNGAALSNDAPSSAPARGRRSLLEFRCPARRGWNFDGRQHRLSMARVSRLRLDRFVHFLHARHFLGGVNVSFPAGRRDLYHAMVFARRIPLVPVDVRSCAGNAFHHAGARSDASCRHLVVRE